MENVFLNAVENAQMHPSVVSNLEKKTLRTFPAE